jgi:hypothetical protein
MATIRRTPSPKGVTTRTLETGTIRLPIRAGIGRDHARKMMQQPVESRGGLNRGSKSARSVQLEDPVVGGLERARRAWHEYEANRKVDKNAVYVYLKAVFDVVQKWKEMGMANEYSLRALKQHEFPIRMKGDPYIRVIYCTSEVDDAKTRSKWAKVMRWVANHNKKGEPFGEFVKRHGGVNECVSLVSLDR